MTGRQDQDTKKMDLSPKLPVTQYRFNQPVRYQHNFYIVCTLASWQGKGKYYTYGLGTIDGVVKHPEAKESDMKRATREDLKAQEARKVARSLRQEARNAGQKARKAEEKAEEAEEKAEMADLLAEIARAKLAYEYKKQNAKNAPQKAPKA